MLLKSCRCGKLIPQSMKMCEECEQRQQSRHMIYNNTRRDERAAEFYVSKEWRAMRERIIEVYDNIDIYALYVEHELLTCNPVHHTVSMCRQLTRMQSSRVKSQRLSTGNKAAGR